jgi:hypothetical protein
VVVTDATRRLLWGALTAAVSWPILAVTGAPARGTVALAVVAVIALFDTPGIAVAGVIAALAVGAPDAPAKAVTAGLLVLMVAALLALPARWLARRGGPAPLDALALAVAVGVLAVGPPGALVAPVVVAVVRVVLRGGSN